MATQAQNTPIAVRVDTRVLTAAVNKRLRTKHSASYIGSVLAGHKGSAALKDVVAQEHARIIREAADLLPRLEAA